MGSQVVSYSRPRARKVRFGPLPSVKVPKVQAPDSFSDAGDSAISDINAIKNEIPCKACNGEREDENGNICGACEGSGQKKCVHSPVVVGTPSETSAAENTAGSNVTGKAKHQ